MCVSDCHDEGGGGVTPCAGSPHSISCFPLHSWLPAGQVGEDVGEEAAEEADEDDEEADEEADEVGGEQWEGAGY